MTAPSLAYSRAIFGSGTKLLSNFLYLLPAPWLITPSPKRELWRRGVYVGIDLVRGDPVYWRIEESPAPHVLALGPSGVGKTEALISIALRLSHFLRASVLCLDLKGEMGPKLMLRRVSPLVLRVGHDPLGLLCSFRRSPAALSLFTDLLLDLAPSGPSASYRRSILKRILQESASWRSAYSTAKGISGLEDVAELLELLAWADPYVCGSRGYEPLEAVRRGGALILDLSPALKASHSVTSLLMASALIAASTRHTGSWRAVVVDEAWSLGRAGLEVLIRVLRLSRTFSSALLLASQNPRDLDPYSYLIAESSGLFIAFGGGSREYWRWVGDVVKLSRSDVDFAATRLGIGQGVVRIAPDPRPLFVYVDILPEVVGHDYFSIPSSS